jgi:hypothetical protein
MASDRFYIERTWFGRWIYKPFVYAGLAFFILSMAFALLGRSRVWLPGILPLLGGYMLFVIAKLSVIRRGIVISWGSHLMSLPMMLCYLAGHVVMCWGFLLVFSGH